MILEKPFAAVVTIGVPAARALMHAFENGSYDLRILPARVPRAYPASLQVFGQKWFGLPQPIGYGRPMFPPEQFIKCRIRFRTLDRD